MPYDKSNIFANIISGEVESDKIYENQHTLVIKDKFPVAPVHLLAIPKNGYVNYHDFLQNAENNEVLSYFSAIKDVIEKMNLDEKHYRLITNAGAGCGQTIFHFHTHIISGTKISKLI